MPPQEQEFHRSAPVAGAQSPTHSKPVASQAPITSALKPAANKPSSNKPTIQIPEKLSRARKTAGLIAAAVGGVGSVGVAARAETTPPTDFFPVGVYLQPVSTFDTWKARGVNTVVDFWPGAQSLETWNAAAVSRGLYMIRAPRTNPAQDVNEKYLLAWSQPDEPDYKGIAASAIQQTYANLKAVDPNRPVYINFQGANVIYPNDALNQPQYQAYIKGGDWIANDVYPVTAWNKPEYIDLSKSLQAGDPALSNGLRWTPGNAVDVLRQWSGGKKQFAYIETSYQDLNSPFAATRGVTPGELRGEVWDAIIHGAKGIVYFPQEVGTNAFKDDNTPADVAAEITKQDALIAQLGGVLNGGSDATDNRITVTSGGKTNPLLEATWRTYQGHKYLFVLNLSSATLSDQSFMVAGLTGNTALGVFDESRDEPVIGGMVNDTFTPYQLHVYETGVVGGVAGVGSSVPEPTGSFLLLAGVGTGLMRRRRRAA